MLNRFVFLIALLFLVSITSCGKDPKDSRTAYKLVQPPLFPNFPGDVAENMTEEGIQLGRRLFYDPILSGDSTMSCATCHKQEDAFTDIRKFSIGIDGSIGNRQAMAITNLAWMEKFFWDGRSLSIEAQALEPVINPIEMNAHWDIIVADLKTHATYLELFEKAFPGQEITKNLAAEAIAQFEKTIISSYSRFDSIENGAGSYTESEIRGKELFFSEQADCFHCHATSLFTDNIFHNNGLDTSPEDYGLELVTNNENDRGKFKTPTLRNISFTAPYMHDGRFETLDEVLDFYSTGVQMSPTVDPLMEFSAQGGVVLNDQEKADLKAFLLLLNDYRLVNNPDFSSPF